MKKPRPRQSGLFVTFEGTEGAGKSTLIRALTSLLGESRPDIRVTATREPGGSAVAERIRKIILEESMDPWCELFLYEAARAEHLSKTLRPALDRGELVLCDRFTDSSLAYQAHARGLEWKQVVALNRIATQGISPDLTVLIDIDPAIGLERASDRNRFEAEGLEFQKKVRAGFLRARRENPKRWMVLKGSESVPAEVLAKSVLKEVLKRWGKR